ncbi:MAG TPA: TIGR03067 domain-containing protein [Gemmatales bacterium]|nr:TIGR03067 domain-containing protein [Gemmatales bacterium]HMP57789.1 TIGR03067 domain-containing protein [Gemmatales bacterium]
MRCFLALLALVMLSLGSFADDKKEDAKPELKGDLKLIQGKWQITLLERDGVRITEEDLKSAAMKINGDRFEYDSPVDGTQEGTLKLDDTKKPKHMDVTVASGDKVLAIYEIKDDELKVCYTGPGSDRPTELSGSSDSGATLIVMKRKK